MPTVTGRATDFITFSRPGATGGGATVTDSDGKIKWAGHNLLTNSESFDASAWVKNGVSVSANAFAAPNGTTTADKLIASNTTAVHRTYVTALPDFTKTAVIFARAAEYNFISIGQTTGAYAVVNLTTGAVTQSSGTIPAPVFVGSGWWRIEIPNTTTDYVLSVVDTGTFTADQYGSKSFTGDNTSGVYVWGAHLYRSDLGGMVLNPARGDAYYPTTPRNLLGSTEDFSAAAWVKTNILAFGSGSISNAIVAPNGLQTADKIVSSTANNNHRVQWSVAGVLVSNTKYVFSFYAKAAEYTKVQIADAVYSVYSARFDLTGSGSVVASSGCTAAITSVGDGWYRCSAIYTSGGANAWAHISPYPDSGATFSVDGASYLGDGISGIYVWGAQLSDSASLDAYSPVYGAAVTSAAYYAPRLDYDANGSALGLLVEEQRTNGITNSEAFDQSSWSKNQILAFGSGSIANATTAPSGVATADKIVEDTNNNVHYVGSNTVTGLSSGAVVTGSVYLKASEITYAAVLLSDTVAKNYAVLFNLSNGTVVGNFTNATAYAAPTSSSISPAGNGWYRCSVTATLDAGRTTATISVATNKSGVTTSGFTYTGDGVSGLFVWGAQLEAGSFATSYIPNGSAVAGATRTADVASVSTQAFPYSASEGTLVASGSRFSTTGANCVIAELGDGGATNIFELYRVSGSTSGALYVASGGVGSTITVSNAFPLDTVSKIGGVYKANDFQAAANGTLGTPVTSGAVPTAASNLYIGKYGGLLTNQWNGHIRQITYLPRRISNSELQARTV